MTRGQHTSSALRHARRVANKHQQKAETPAPGKRTKKGFSLSTLFLALLIIAGVSMAGFAVAPTPRASAATATTDTPPPPCPAGYTCVSIPCSSSQCPTIEAGPTSDISSNPQQYAFVNLYDFPAGDTPEVLLCADTTPLSQAAPMCSIGLPSPPISAPIFSDGEGFASTVVPEIENNGGTGLDGEVLGNDSDKGTFYCDNGPDYCSVVVYDYNLNDSTTPSSANTAVIPVSFAAAETGCKNPTLINSASDFGIEGLIQTVDSSGCTGSHPTLDFNTALDSLNAVTALAAGRYQIAFTDDPEAPDEQAVLGGSGGGYALIPIAVSADVVGFSAIISGVPPAGENTYYPHTSFELTPNMIAGLITGQYNEPGAADDVPVKCTSPTYDGGKVDPCPAMEFLNSVSGFEPEEDYQAYLRSDNTGVTDELLHWLCSAPDHSVPINKKTVTEPDTAAQVIEAAQWSDSKLDGTCPETDQFPALADGVTSNTEEDPQNQAKALYTQVSADATPPRQAGFTTMNWYEALYYGLDIADLQNATGAFVAPTAASVSAALADATSNPDGTLSFNYADTSGTNAAAAYPEPVVIYAAVSTKPQAASQADGIKTILDNLVSLTSSSSTVTLPDGILPLTSTMTSAARADIAKDIVAEPPPRTPPPTTTTTTPTTTRTTTPGVGTSTPGTGTGGGGTSVTTPVTSGVTTPTTVATLTKPGKGGPPPTSPPTPVTPTFFRSVQVGLAAPEWRWLLVAMLFAGGITICAGPLILVAQRLRKRLAVVRQDKT
jgi:PBP superfamily domain